MVCCKCCQGYASLCRVFTFGWIVAAVVFSCLAVASCEFTTRSNLGIGLFRFEVTPENSEDLSCVGYSDIEDFSYGWLHDWSRISALLAPLIGVFGLFLMLLDCCCDICCNKYMGTFLIVCCWLNQGFTFLLYASSACLTPRGPGGDAVFIGCRFGEGSGFSIIAFFLYFIGGFFLCCSPKPDKYCCNNDDDNEDKKKCCGKKDKEAKSVEADEEAPKEQEPAVAAAAVVVNKEEEKQEEKEEEKQEEKEEEKQEEKEEEPPKNEEEVKAKAVGEEEKPVENSKVEESNKVEAVPATDEEDPPVAEEGAANNDEEPTPTAEDEEEQEQETPVVVPVPIPVPVPVVAPRAKTPPPEDLSMEIEFDEEFGTSQVRAPIME